MLVIEPIAQVIMSKIKTRTTNALFGSRGNVLAFCSEIQSGSELPSCQWEAECHSLKFQAARSLGKFSKLN